MKELRQPSLILAAVALLYMAGSAGAEEPLDIWDLELGIAAADIPDAFVDYACGTNGGPPARALTHFRDFASCRAEPSGLHEVYFRYDDEQEYIARALQQAHQIERYRGTRVYGFDAIVSALFDDRGILRGIRIVTDPRGVQPGDRSDHWRLGDLLQRHFGEEGWACTDQPLGERETAIASFSVNRSCSKQMPGTDLKTRQEYFHGRGESFTDEFGKVLPTYFVSTTSFEMISTSD